MYMHRSYYWILLLSTISPTFSTRFYGLSPEGYSYSKDQYTETDNTRRFFEPNQSRDLSNVIVDKERGVVYVGAVNYLYALDAEDVTIKRGEIEWAPESSQLTICQNFKGDAVRCQNMIKVLHSVNDTFIFACGTMAFSPSCIYVNKEDFKRVPGPSERGKWRSPEDPLSSTVSTMSGNSLFSATTPSLPNKNGVICKTNGEASSPVKTNDNDDFCLSDPQFVSAFTVPEEGNQEKVIVLLKENAEEIPMEILTPDHDYSASMIYSRLVSICANDRGGNPWILKDKFATFTKMRIACPVQIKRGKSRRTIPFFYDEIQSSFIVENPSQPNNPTIYAIFSTPSGAFEATATCVYEMNEIRRYLDTNKYWNKPGSSRNLYSTYEDSESPPPGTCVQDTTALSASRLSFGNEHPIKYGIIKPKDGYAVYQEAGMTYSHIIVDRIKRKEKFGSILSEKEYDVVHYITESGFIKRVVFSVQDRSKNWEIPSRRLYKQNETVSTILTVKINNGFLYFGTVTSLVQLKIAACSRYTTCAECSLSNDPYCDWSELDSYCEAIPFDVPMKRPPLPYRHLNETICDLNDVNPGKKSDVVGELQEANIETLRAQNAALLELTQDQNVSISKLRRRNDFMSAKLSESMDELSSLTSNYSHLSALLLQYDARRRLVMQLYKNTVFSLHACQHARAQKKSAERGATLEMTNNNNKASFNATYCEQWARERSSNTECDCNQRSTADARGRVIPKTAIPPSLESCHAQTSRLQRHVDELRDLNRNMNDERETLQRKVVAVKEENEKLKAAFSAGQHIGCGENKWLLYAPSNKMFLFTNKVANYGKAAKICSTNGGEIATIKTDHEVNYMYNVTRSLSPRKRYWLGIRKIKGTTLTWSDGTVVDADIGRRFTINQRGKLSNGGTYCVETTPLKLEWHLTSCQRIRKVVCTKEYDGEIR